MNSPTQNNGERGEKRVILELLLHKDDPNWLVRHFGDEAAEGIEVINPVNNQTITRMDQIQNAPSSIKADIKIKFKRSRRVIGISIKYFQTANPCILNCTSREKFINNNRLQPYLGTFDLLIGQYLQDPGDTSERDRKLSDFTRTLTVEQQREVAAAIAYFTLDGTGRGDAQVPANGVLDMYHRTEEIRFTEMTTDEEKIQYVLHNWNRYVLSIRGVKQTRSGRLRGNGMSTVNPPTEEQLPWVCMYDDNGVMRPRGALAIRIKR